MQASKRRSDSQDQVSLHFAFTKSNTRKKRMKRFGCKKEAKGCRSASAPLLEDTVEDFKSDVNQQQVARPPSVYAKLPMQRAHSGNVIGHRTQNETQRKERTALFSTEWAQRPSQQTMSQGQSYLLKKGAPPEPYNAGKCHESCIMSLRQT